MRSHRTLSAVLSVMPALLFAAACEVTTDSDPGTLTVQLTDKPFPFSEVERVDVHVVRVDARRENVDADDAEDADDRSGWITVASPDETINLLELSGGRVSTLGSASLSPGTYAGFRLIIDPAQSGITLTDGFEPDVQWPSAAQTGIKINLVTPVVVESDSSVLIVDFDVGRSFVLRGNSIRNNGLLFKPVLQAVATDITGSVSGTVRAETADGAAVEGATVELLLNDTPLDDTDDASVVASTFTNASGEFTFGFVLPGTYELRVTPPDGSPLTATLLDGGVTVGTSADVTGIVVVLEQ